jgi:hypothetical protein
LTDLDVISPFERWGGWVTKRWVLTAVFWSLMIVVGGSARKEESFEEEEELEDGEGGDSGECMCCCSGVTAREFCCKDTERLLSEVK